jgi:hypothetical protein
VSEKDELREIKQKLCEVENKLDTLKQNDFVLESEMDLILERVDKILNSLTVRPTGGVIDILGDHVSTTVGTSSNFQFAYTPAGSVPPAGTTQKWTVDVTDVTLTPSADGFTCQAAVPATETATAYNLTCTSSYTPPGAPTPISFTLNVPIVPAGVLPTGGTITQLS